MKYFFIITMILFGLAGQVEAQSINLSNYAMIASRETDSLTSKLNLTQMQIPLVDSANHKFYRDIVTLSQQLTADQRKVAILQFEVQKDSSLQAVLSESQWQLYLEELQQRKLRFQNKRRQQSGS
jgi:hypothetical protein